MQVMLRKPLLVSLALLMALPVITVNLQVALGKNKVLSTSTQGWESVKMVPPGDKIAVSLKDGKTLKGQLRSVSDTNLFLYHENKVSDLARDRISKVYRLVSKSAASSVLLGAGIGGAIGLGVGSINDDNKAVTMPGLAVIGAGIGAIIGLVRNRQKKVLIYEV